MARGIPVPDEVLDTLKDLRAKCLKPENMDKFPGKYFPKIEEFFNEMKAYSDNIDAYRETVANAKKELQSKLKAAKTKKK